MNDSINLLQFINGYKVSYALFIAAEYQLFQYLKDGDTAKNIAEKINVNEKSLEIFLDFFCSMSLLKKLGAEYFIQPNYSKLLSDASDSCMLNLIKLESYLSSKHHSLERLREVLITGNGKDDLNLNKKENQEVIYANAMDAGSQYSSLCIAREFSGLKEGCILDIGGGIGTYAIKLSQIKSNVTVDILDKEEMKDLCMNNIRKNQMDKRIQFISGDILEYELENKYDGVLISNVLHIFKESDIQRLLIKVMSCLNPKGILVIHDFFLPQDKVSDSITSIYSLDWLMQGSFFNYSCEEIMTLLSNVGFHYLRQKKYQEIPTSIVVVEKL